MTRHPRVGALINRFAGSQPRPAFAPAGSDVAARLGGRLSSTRNVSFRLSVSVSRTGTALFARDGLLGVDSIYFDHILLVRELVETALQTYQVYRMSQLLPRLWLIRFYVALLVGNCWAVPLLHRYYCNKETTRRMLCLLCDAVLDMVSSIGISLIIFSNYVPQYNDPKFSFRYMNWFNDHWLANMQQEFQMMLVVSWADMVSRLVFALGLLQCMEAIKEMLTPATNNSPTATTDARKEKLKQAIGQSAAALTQQVPQLRSVVAPVGAGGESHEPTDVVSAAVNPASIDHSNGVEGGPMTDAISPPQPTIEALANVKGPLETSHSHTRFQRIVHFIVHILGPALFVAWGCAILVVHLVAESHYSDAACELRLKPWLSSKPGCSIIEINCYNIQSTGQDETITAALEVYDPERAARVAFRHCPALVLTPKIQEFKNMVGLKIYNSTVSWDATAAITGTHHESMRSLFLIRTFFPNGELPPGLLTDDFPPSHVRHGHQRDELARASGRLGHQVGTRTTTRIRVFAAYHDPRRARSSPAGSSVIRWISYHQCSSSTIRDTDVVGSFAWYDADPRTALQRHERESVSESLVPSPHECDNVLVVDGSLRGITTAVPPTAFQRFQHAVLS